MLALQMGNSPPYLHFARNWSSFCFVCCELHVSSAALLAGKVFGQFLMIAIDNHDEHQR